MCLFFKQLREARDLLLFKSDRLLETSVDRVLDIYPHDPEWFYPIFYVHPFGDPATGQIARFVWRMAAL
jgi:hypothetical protein